MGGKRRFDRSVTRVPQVAVRRPITDYARRGHSSGLRLVPARRERSSEPIPYDPGAPGESLSHRGMSLAADC